MQSYLYIYWMQWYIQIFNISKIKLEVGFLGVPLKTSLFSIARFIYGWQKIFTNKNTFSKSDLHFLFRTFYSKMFNNKHLFSPGWSP